MPAGVSAYTALANVTLGSSAATVTFSSISQAYRDLVLVISGTKTTSSGDFVNVEINANTTAANYSQIAMEGNGSSTWSGSASGSYAFVTNGLNNPTFSNSQVANTVFQFMDYSATDKHKTVLVRGNKADAAVTAVANRFASTSAITQLKVMLYADSFATGSTFALYGVSA